MSKWHVESLYIGRYIGTGAFNTLLGFAVIFGLMMAGFSPLIANIAGYSVGFVLGFVFSKKITFRSNGGVLAEGFRYLLAFIIAFALNIATLHVILKETLIPPMFAQVIAAIVYTMMMYVLTRFYVFSPSQPSPKRND
jgi:putative flippase GtrA